LDARIDPGALMIYPSDGLEGHEFLEFFDLVAEFIVIN